MCHAPSFEYIVAELDVLASGFARLWPVQDARRSRPTSSHKTTWVVGRIHPSRASLTTKQPVFKAAEWETKCPPLIVNVRFSLYVSHQARKELYHA